MSTAYQLLSALAALALLTTAAAAILTFGPPALRLQTPAPRGSIILLSVSGILLVSSVVALSIVKANYQERGRRTLMARLAQLGPQPTVRLNSKPISEVASRGVVAALATVGQIGAHHSAPKGTAQLEITSDAVQIELLVARDSERENEFWVYLPGTPIPPNRVGARALGRMSSPELQAVWNLIGRAEGSLRETTQKPSP